MKKRFLAACMALVMAILPIFGSTKAYAGENNALVESVIASESEDRAGTATYFTTSTSAITAVAGTRIKQVNCNTDGNIANIEWTSSDSSVAVVEQYGYVRALKQGVTYVTGKLDGFTINCTITVTSSSSTNISLYRIDFDVYEKTIDIGESFKINIIYVPSNTTDDRTAKWTTTDSSVATVDSNGNVRGISSGTVTIRAVVGNRARSCTVKVSDGSIPMTGISMNKTKMTLVKGTNEALSVAFIPENTTQNRDIVWSTSESPVATVSTDGRVYGVGTGVAIIKATSNNGLETACTVTVVEADEVVEGISLSKTSITLDRGGSYGITATLKPEGAGDEADIVWSSKNTAIATVSSSGIIKAVAPGNTVITASIGDFSADVDVTVVATLKSISLNVSSMEVTQGMSKSLQVNYTPLDTTSSRTITWTSNNNSVASVDSTGKVTGVSVGTAKITATCGTLTASCNVTCTKNTVQLTAITLNKYDMTLTKGAYETLIVGYTPDNTTDNKTVTWKSNNTAVATVDAAGKVTAVSAGSAIISATCGTVSTSCNVSVKVPLTGITMDQTLLTVNKGSTGNLSATITPLDTTDGTIYTWYSDDINVATVDQHGVVTGVGAGTTQINVLCGKFSSKCTVTVKVPLTGISLNKTTLALNKGATGQLGVTYNPTDTTDSKAITWYSSSDRIATVDSKGNVTAVALGTTTIYAMSGAFSASCTVTITAEDVQLTAITVNKSSISLSVGQSENLTIIPTPINTTDSVQISWRSSNTGVATVDANGKVTAVGAGSATITASCGNLTSKCNVSVGKALTGISLNKTTLIMDKGATGNLQVTYTPADTTDSKTITWRSSNTGVATVDANGKVTAVGAGSATITATCGSYTATCSITVQLTKKDLIEAFVQRMYTIVLNRDAEAEGLTAWTGFLYNNQCSGAEMLKAFIEGKEFIARNLSDSAYMDVVYKAVMGRDSDTDGKNVWMNVLTNGMSRTFVLSGFVGSTEFTDICESYGITKGNVVTTEGRDRNYNVTCFVQRFYTKVLNRGAEVSGLNTWCNAILDKQITPQEAARMFVFSSETESRNLSDAEYIKMLYRTFMGRECESTDILNGWVSYISTQGHTRAEAFEMFANSKEFADIVKSYGL